MTDNYVLVVDQLAIMRSTDWPSEWLTDRLTGVTDIFYWFIKIITVTEKRETDQMTNN